MTPAGGRLARAMPPAMSAFLTASTVQSGRAVTR
jgi:hypothetical protein